MFAVGISYLNGWAMAAADGAKKEVPEWPPHPDRLFMALAAAWFETKEEEDERSALRWLEGLRPPAILASEATSRMFVTSYVPVNDDRGGKKSAPKNELDRLRNKGLALVPEHRLRQPRGFPVAIPHDPTVHLIWLESELDDHLAALERLAAKVTHIGHSSSLVQVWIERDTDIKPNLIPVEGIAAHRLRVPSPGRLDQLALLFQQAWQAYHDNIEQLEQAEADRKAIRPPPRTAWRRHFPNAILLANETDTRQHPDYAAAKSGDVAAARRLIGALLNEPRVDEVQRLVEPSNQNAVALVSAHAYEREGVNAIPAALAEWLSARLDIPYIAEIVQSNVVSHTGADGYGRLARQARFEGAVDPERQYVLVDDFIGQGGTMANLRGWIEKEGGSVVGAVGLTGKPYSARLAPTKEQLDELRAKHGPDFEKWWRKRFGHAFNCLTQSEARYLARSPDVDTIRDRLAAAERSGDRTGNAGSARRQSQRIAELKSYRAPSPRRSVPSRWQGYGRPPPPVEPTRHTVFDENMVVLSVRGQPVTLPATLKLTAALRGLLLHECPVQPPPEWFSGHRSDGAPSADPHMALVPLPFVGSLHADGRIMGLGVVVPVSVSPQEVGRFLEPILRDPKTGLARDDLRLFSGESFELGVELDNRERPPWNLKRQTWTRASRTWASVSPVVLNRHFDGVDRWERAAEGVKDACEHIGLPRPGQVLLHPVSLVEGVPHAREYPRLTRKHDGGKQSHAHAVIIFDERVAGPLLVGAGRFRGYGLCRPLDN